MSETSKPKPVIEILSNSDLEFDSILQHIETIKLIQSTISQILDPVIAQKCQVVNIRSKTLVISTENANWASRLRYQTSDLLKAVQADPRLPLVDTIRVVTIPSCNKATATDNNRLMLSQRTSNELRKIAETTTDPELKQCLLKITKHTKSEISP